MKTISSVDQLPVDLAKFIREASPWTGEHQLCGHAVTALRRMEDLI